MWLYQKIKSDDYTALLEQNRVGDGQQRMVSEKREFPRGSTNKNDKRSYKGIYHTT